MNEMPSDPLEGYFEQAQRWSADREESLRSSRRTAWIVASIAAVLALLEGLALVFLTPLKSSVPYTVLVDRHTGYVEVLQPLDEKLVSPDAALTRSLLAQYVTTREEFDFDTVRADYRKVALWSTGEERSRYMAAMQASNPLSPLVTLGRRALVEVQILSVSSLGKDTALVRFTTNRTDPEARGQPPQFWAAVLKYRFTSLGMTAADRLQNPLGFQVVRYRRDSETAPSSQPQAAQPAVLDSRQVRMPPSVQQ